MGGYGGQREMFSSIVWAVAKGGEDKSMAWFLCLRTGLSHGGQTPSRSSGSICGLNLPSIRHFFPFALKAKVRLGQHLKALEVETDVRPCLSLF